MSNIISAQLSLGISPPLVASLPASNAMPFPKSLVCSAAGRNVRPPERGNLSRPRARVAHNCSSPSRTTVYWFTPQHGARPTAARQQRPSCCSRPRPPSEILDLGTPTKAARRVVGREQPHSRRPADLDGDLSHGAHLLSGCAAVQGAPEVPFELGVYLLCPH